MHVVLKAFHRHGFMRTEIDGQIIKLSNLDKVLYPSIPVTKAHVIKYYLEIAPTVLKYIRGRPLTTIRFPDGVKREGFYSKNKPDWTPSHFSTTEIRHETKVIEYLVPNQSKDLVWLANQACLELHPMQSTIDRIDSPDHFIFDMDPDPGMGFEDLKESCWLVRERLIQCGYAPLIKTSGGKGFHIYVPLKGRNSYDAVINAVKTIAKEMVRDHDNLLTLNLKKTDRKDRILLDIFRNHRSNTAVAPYSLRGKKGAPISTPISWDELTQVSNSQEFTIDNIWGLLSKRNDPWSNWEAQEAPLHTKKQHFIDSLEVADSLKPYTQKRDFTKSPEPIPMLDRTSKQRYVIQRHDASNLHYDLRLECDGVLMSWAIPKGLPLYPGEKRLAIRTEDHPVAYLDFEGVIPKNQYGAGSMWIMDSGEFNWVKNERDKLEFTLDQEYKTHYYLFKTDEPNKWMIRLKATNRILSMSNEMKPMLAESQDVVPSRTSFDFEVKWDGIRALIHLSESGIRIVSRNGNDLTNQFPELIARESFRCKQGVFDGEICCLDAEGKPQFHHVISRMHTTGKNKINSAVNSKKAMCYLFDVGFLDGFDVRHYPIEKRRQLLANSIGSKIPYRISEPMEDGEALFDAIEMRGMEGIIAKRRRSTYQSGVRSMDWIKVKTRQLAECHIIGYTEGKGDRRGLIGSFHLAEKDGDKWIYRGRVGTGFDQSELKRLSKLVRKLPIEKKLIEEMVDEENMTTWVKPDLECRIQYASMSSNNSFREPVFLSLINE